MNGWPFGTLIALWLGGIVLISVTVGVLGTFAYSRIMAPTPMELIHQDEKVRIYVESGAKIKRVYIGSVKR